jgi:hypothetical protein
MKTPTWSPVKGRVQNVDALPSLLSALERVAARQVLIDPELVEHLRRPRVGIARSDAASARKAIAGELRAFRPRLGADKGPDRSYLWRANRARRGSDLSDPLPSRIEAALLRSRPLPLPAAMDAFSRFDLPGRRPARSLGHRGDPGGPPRNPDGPRPARDRCLRDLSHRRASLGCWWLMRGSARSSTMHPQPAVTTTCKQAGGHHLL